MPVSYFFFFAKFQWFLIEVLILMENRLFVKIFSYKKRLSKRIFLQGNAIGTTHTYYYVLKLHE